MTMKRGKPSSKVHKKGQWTRNQKLQAVSTYLMLGNMAQTAIVTGIPLPTLKLWKQHDWFNEYVLQLKTEDIQQMDSNLKRVVDKALKAVEDRIDYGDAVFDQKTGAIVKLPIKANVALKISTELLTKQEKINNAPVREELEKTIDQRLLKLSEEFARFAGMKQIDVQGNIVEQA